MRSSFFEVGMREQIYLKMGLTDESTAFDLFFCSFGTYLCFSLHLFVRISVFENAFEIPENRM